MRAHRRLAIAALVLAALTAPRTGRAAVQLEPVYGFCFSRAAAAGGAKQNPSETFTTPGGSWTDFQSAISTNGNSSNAATVFSNFGLDLTLGLDGGLGGIITTVGSSYAYADYDATCHFFVTDQPVECEVGYTASSTGHIDGTLWLFDYATQTERVRFEGSAPNQLTVTDTLPPGEYLASIEFSDTEQDGGSANFGTGAFLHFRDFDLQPQVVLQPVGLPLDTTQADPTLTLTAGANGAGPMQSQWIVNGAPLSDGGDVSGATTDVLVIHHFGAVRNGAYACVYQNALAADTSDIAVCEAGVVSSLPRITSQPRDQAVGPFGNLFDVRAFSSGPMTYQWKHNGVPVVDGDAASGATLAGAQTAGLVILNATAAEAGEYQCMVANAFGPVSSEIGHLTLGTTAVGPSAPGAVRFVAGPNPARGASALQFTLPAAGNVRLDVFDLSGRRMATLEDGPLGPGVHVDTWDLRDASGTRVAPGLYLARLSASGVNEVRRVIVVR